ncbi:MAG: L-serine ammonia-lyase, partial [Candidatus Marinimicrobia bacterium]|nr:L-serine ammonia-lyase [Candidatus Neomarinimicrobiota bacterium]
GIGPSSSHTVGPWLAASRFIQEVLKGHITSANDTVVVDLYGSLALTGIGHGTDFAILMGLSGYKVDSISEQILVSLHGNYESINQIIIGQKTINFNPIKSINFWKDQFLPYHPNGITFRIIDQNDQLIHSKTYYSIGGGFVLSEDELSDNSISDDHTMLSSAKAIKGMLKKTGKSLIEILTDHELKYRPTHFTIQQLENIYQVMIDCTYKGCHTEGVLPGGLSLQRRAKGKHTRLIPERDYNNANEWLLSIRRKTFSFRQTIDWVRDIPDRGMFGDLSYFSKFNHK